MLVAMLTGIVALGSVYGLTRNSPAPPLAPRELNPALIHTQREPEPTTAAVFAEAPPAERRVSVSFNDDRDSAYALLKGVPAADKAAHLPEVDVWYGEYFKEQNLRVLSASPIEREPSRLGLKVSFAF